MPPALVQTIGLHPCRFSMLQMPGASSSIVHFSRVSLRRLGRLQSSCLRLFPSSAAGARNTRELPVGCATRARAHHPRHILHSACCGRNVLRPSLARREPICQRDRCRVPGLERKPPTPVIHSYIPRGDRRFQSTAVHRIRRDPRRDIYRQGTIPVPFPCLCRDAIGCRDAARCLLWPRRS